MSRVYNIMIIIARDNNKEMVQRQMNTYFSNFYVNKVI